MPPKHPYKFQLPRPASAPVPQFSAARRRFLQVSAAAVSGVVLSNCARNLSNPSGQTSSSPTASSSPASSDSKTLYVYTWANYTDDELLKNFQEQTGIRVVVDVFDSNEAMLAKLQAGGGSAYSVIYPSDYMVAEMVKLGLLSELDRSRLQGVDQLNPKWKSPVYDPDNAHNVPFAWGTTGLIYNPKKLGTQIEGWDYVWENVRSLNRKVTLINDVREVMGATLMYLGYSSNSTKAAEIEQAYAKLVELKPAIAAFLTNGWEDQIASGDIAIAMGYSVDALSLMAENPDLRYVIPETGASLWTDTMAIPKSAPNPDAAYEWLNFMLKPENNSKLVERLNFATPNQAAFDSLSAKFKNNQALFPPSSILTKCQGVAPLPEKVTAEYDRYWTQLTSS